ncbi:MAG: alkaline phosphatase family protein [Actinoallomurus sp.]
MAARAADSANGPYVMGYHTRGDIPFQFTLAESFTVCDNYFCSVMGPTWPNRLYLMGASIDPGGTKGGPIISNADPEPENHVSARDPSLPLGAQLEVASSFVEGE